MQDNMSVVYDYERVHTDVYQYYWYYSISFKNTSSQKANNIGTFVKTTQGQKWLNLNVTRGGFRKQKQSRVPIYVIG